jgi:serine/threonine-protein kinase
LQLIDNARSMVGERALLCAARAMILWQYHNAGIRPEETALQTADALADEALALDGECSQALIARGSVAYTRGRLQEAARALRRAAELDRSSDAFAALSHVCSLNDKFDAARDYADRALSSDPFNPWALWARGTCELLCGDLGAAVDRYRAGAVVAPDDPLLLFFEAIALAQAGEAQEALLGLERVVLLVPDWASWVGMVVGALRTDLGACPSNVWTRS